MPRRPTSAYVAAMAGVSRTTVSFVLNGRADVKIPDETRRRVIDERADECIGQKGQVVLTGCATTSCG